MWSCECAVEKFYRIKISYQEPDRLSAAIKSQFKHELANNTLYLGIRFNPTNFNRSAAINSLELAYQFVELFENTATEYGRVVCYVKEYACYNDFMKTIIDTDSRTLIKYIESSGFKFRNNKIPLQKVL